MTRLNIVLLMAVLASALYLVRTQYESRRLFVEVEKAQALARKLDIDRERLEVEKRAQATPLRVEKLAKDQLQMRSATPAVTQYVKMAQATVTTTTGTAPTPGSSGAAAGARP
jgi:cell division protein FtsL